MRDEEHKHEGGTMKDERSASFFTPQPSALDSRPLRVLLIEDNPGDARLLREMLGEVPTARFELTRAERLSEAMERVTRQRFDVILSDLSLPDSRGLETFHAISARAPG